MWVVTNFHLRVIQFRQVRNEAIFRQTKINEKKLENGLSVSVSKLHSQM
jgi:hypothetical protein